MSGNARVLKKLKIDSKCLRNFCLLTYEKLRLHSKSCVMDILNHTSFQVMIEKEKKCIFTDPFVRIRGTGNKLQHFGSLFSQTPAIKDFSIAFLKVIKLLSIGRVQEPE